MRSNKSVRSYNYIRIIGIILFLYILFRIDLQEVFLTLKNINLFYFFLAIALLPISHILAILKWRMLINSQGLKIPFRPLTEIFFKGFFWGIITPGKLGELWKTKYLSDIIGISGGRSFYTVLMARLIDLIIITTVSVVGIINLFLFNRIKIGWPIIVLLLILNIFIVYFLIKKENTKKIVNFLLKFCISFSLKKKTDSFLDEFFRGLKQLNFVLFVKLLSYGFFYYLTSVLTYYILALSLGISITFFHLFLIIALAWLVLLVPITILGLGTREAGYIFFFAIFNISASVAVAFSSLVLLTGIISSIPGAILFFKNKSH